MEYTNYYSWKKIADVPLLIKELIDWKKMYGKSDEEIALLERKYIRELLEYGIEPEAIIHALYVLEGAEKALRIAYIRVMAIEVQKEIKAENSPTLDTHS